MKPASQHSLETSEKATPRAYTGSPPCAACRSLPIGRPANHSSLGIRVGLKPSRSGSRFPSLELVETRAKPNFNRQTRRYPVKRCPGQIELNFITGGPKHISEFLAEIPIFLKQTRI